MQTFPEQDNYQRPRTPYAVNCVETFGVRPTGCGLVYLTEEEYHLQMRMADYTWRCPICNGTAHWNDDNFEDFLPEENNEPI